MLQKKKKKKDGDLQLRRGANNKKYRVDIINLSSFKFPHFF